MFTSNIKIGKKYNPSDCNHVKVVPDELETVEYLFLCTTTASRVIKWHGGNPVSNSSVGEKALFDKNDRGK